MLPPNVWPWCPMVSIAAADEREDFAMHYLACIGNRAVVTSGLAKGAEGIVTGEHARMLIDFGDEAHELRARGIARALQLRDDKKGERHEGVSGEYRGRLVIANMHRRLAAPQVVVVHCRQVVVHE